MQTASAPSVVQHLGQLQRLRNQLDAYEATVMNEAGRGKVAAGSGESDLTAGLAKAQGVSRAEAARRRRTAEAIEQHRGSRQALEDGDITADQMQALAQAEVPDADKARLLAEAPSQTTDQTRAGVSRAERDHRRESADDRQRRLRRRRSARRWTDGEGMRRFEFTLDPDAAAPVDAALTAMVDRLFREDRHARATDARREDQRLADAFADVVGRPPTASAVADQAHAADAPRVVLNVTLSHDVLLGRCDDVGLTDQGTEVSPSSLRRMACDAEVVPIVLGGPSEVLDLGRSRRVVGTALRRALVARDGGCVVADCDAPPAVCHAHHLVPWAEGGVTNLENLALVCHRHHHYLHASGMELRRSGGCWHTERAHRSRGHP